MATYSYQLTFAGYPFCLDAGAAFRPQHAGRSELADRAQAPAKYQDEPTLLEEIERLLPAQYLQDILPLGFQASRTLNNLAQQTPGQSLPDQHLKIGQFYYPTGASRWSVFRGLVTSTIAKEMIAACFTGGVQAKPFVLKAVPQGAIAGRESEYTVTTDMYLLPPRPLAETRGADGLFLVTLVDERWYWQGTSATLQPWEPPLRSNRTTWANLFDSLAAALGISLTVPTIDAGFLYPEPDSQLWSSKENAAVLLDAVAQNLFLTFVRKLDGTYELMTNADSQSLAETNRGTAQRVIRLAGGDMFSDLSTLKAGDLSATKNAIVPASVDVTFPRYVEPNYSGPGGGDQLNPANAAGSPVPYLLNSRYRNKRPSAWQEDSYGEVYTKNVLITEGGDAVSDLTGKGTHTIATTAKAIYRTEADAAPSNQAELDALALLLAQNYYQEQALTGLDEVLPGILNWEPEGLHDLLWTYSANVRQASLRVMRAPWNLIAREMQHSASYVPRGVGGPTVAQSIRDAFSGSISTSITLRSGQSTATLGSPDNLPTQNRWKGLVGTEKVLFDGTSGGTSVTVAARAIDGTTMGDWNGSTVAQLTPNTTYGVNLTTTEKMQGVYPAEWTSGGVQAVRIVPQTQTVYCFDGSGEVYNGLRHFSGQVNTFDAVAGTYPAQEYVWLIERNELELRSGLKYNGQFAWYSKGAPAAAPIYLVQDVQSSGAASGYADLYLQLSGRYYNFVLNSGYRRILIDARGRVEFPSFRPNSGVKLEVVSYPSSGSAIIYRRGSPLSGVTPQGVITIPGYPLASGGSPTTPATRAFDDFQYPSQARVVESLGDESGGGWTLENPVQKNVPQVGYAPVPITQGQPVATIGANEGVPQLRPAISDMGTAPYAANDMSGMAVGLALTSIASGDFGEWVREGPIFNVDTTGQTAGNVVYLGGAGGFTESKLNVASGFFKQRLGTVLIGGTVSGAILAQWEPPATVMSGEIAYDVVHSGHVGSGQVASGHLASGLLFSITSKAKQFNDTFLNSSGQSTTFQVEASDTDHGCNWWGNIRNTYPINSGYLLNIDITRYTYVTQGGIDTEGTFTETGITLAPNVSYPFNSNLASGGRTLYPWKMDITVTPDPAPDGNLGLLFSEFQ